MIQMRVRPFGRTTLSRRWRTSKYRLQSTVPIPENGPGVSGSHVPTLKHVPSLPFLGSLVPQYSGIPRFDLNRIYDYHPAVRKQYGEFYTLGVPGFGQGFHGTIYTIVDPDEMMKVVRNEGSYPSGTIESHWHMRRVFKNLNSPIVDGDDYGLWDHGERWKKHRVFIQSGMLCPRAAKNFVPGIIKAAEMASKGAPKHRDDLNRFLNYSAIDMFCSFMFGEFLGTAAKDPNQSCDDENGRFCSAVLQIFQTSMALAFSPFEITMNDKLGIKTQKFLELERAYETARSLAMERIQAFLVRYDEGNLNEMENASYLAGAILRQAVEGDQGVSKEEMLELCFVSLFAAVDTTSAMTAWNLIHLAQNPAVQERLHSELSAAMSNVGSAHLDASVLSKASSPYLHAVVRESLRMTPPLAMAQIKSNQRSEIKIHGVTLSKGSIVQLAHIGRDPTYVDDADTFKPERWLPDAVQSRKGTHSEVIDHPIWRDPFFQGARRCPASRVATNEVLAMISQLVLDWKISSPVESLDEITYSGGIVKPDIPALDFIARV